MVWREIAQLSVFYEQGYKIDQAKDVVGEFTGDADHDEWVDASETE